MSTHTIAVSLPDIAAWAELWACMHLFYVSAVACRTDKAMGFGKSWNLFMLVELPLEIIIANNKCGSLPFSRALVVD